MREREKGHRRHCVKLTGAAKATSTPPTAKSTTTSTKSRTLEKDQNTQNEDPLIKGKIEPK